MTSLNGIWPPLITPFRDDRLDETKCRYGALRGRRHRRSLPAGHSWRAGSDTQTRSCWHSTRTPTMPRDYDSPNILWFRSRYARFVHVDRTMVAPSLRDRGYARRLYADLFEHASKTGHTIVVCEVNADPPNPASDAFRDDPRRQQNGHLFFPRIDQHMTAMRYAALAKAIARHTRSGVAGISISVTPSALNASMIALITAGGLPTAPASPAPFTPRGFEAHGISSNSTSISGNSFARGIA
jgi:predicted GNAT family acetyltransferase